MTSTANEKSFWEGGPLPEAAKQSLIQELKDVFLPREASPAERLDEAVARLNPGICDEEVPKPMTRPEMLADVLTIADQLDGFEDTVEAVQELASVERGSPIGVPYARARDAIADARQKVTELAFHINRGPKGFKESA